MASGIARGRVFTKAVAVKKLVAGTYSLCLYDDY